MVAKSVRAATVMLTYDLKWLRVCADVDEQAKKEIKEVLVKYDRTLLVADPRRCEPKKCAPPLLHALQPLALGALYNVSNHTRPVP